MRTAKIASELVELASELVGGRISRIVPGMSWEEMREGLQSSKPDSDTLDSILDMLVRFEKKNGRGTESEAMGALSEYIDVQSLSRDDPFKYDMEIKKGDIRDVVLDELISAYLGRKDYSFDLGGRNFSMIESDYKRGLEGLRRELVSRGVGVSKING